MSVDVFGRKLKDKTNAPHRGPPGVGFKLTPEGHFDLENKQLTNLAPPKQPNDAVNLKTVQDMVARLRSDLDDLSAIVKAELERKNINNQNAKYWYYDAAPESGGGASQASKT